MRIFAFLTLILFALMHLITCDNWNYGNHGIDWTGICATGKKQSPINIPLIATNAPVKNLNVEFVYKTFSTDDADETKLEKEDELIFANVKDHGYIIVTGLLDDSTLLVFKLTKLYFHTKSEHKYADKQYDLEMQLVHQLISNNTYEYIYFVISIFFTSEDKDFNDIDFFTAMNTNDLSRFDDLDIGEYMSNLLDKKAVIYNGSLSIPACEETATNLVYYIPQKISTLQLNQFLKHHNNTYREVQVLGDQRKLFYISQVLNAESFAIAPLPFFLLIFIIFILIL